MIAIGCLLEAFLRFPASINIYRLTEDEPW